VSDRDGVPPAVARLLPNRHRVPTMPQSLIDLALQPIYPAEECQVKSLPRHIARTSTDLEGLDDPLPRQIPFPVTDGLEGRLEHGPFKTEQVPEPTLQRH